MVNVTCALVLHPPGSGASHGHSHEHHHHHDHGARDHNLRAAYLHVLMDALTSVLAIIALVAGRSVGWAFLDPVMGVVGGLLVLRWGVGLLRAAGRELLDMVPSHTKLDAIRARLQDLDEDLVVADLHLWEMGLGRKLCVVSVVTHDPQPVEVYRSAIEEVAHIDHLTVEVHRCDGPCGQVA